MRTVIAAVDNSLAARPVLATAVGLGELLSAAVELVHVRVDGDQLALAAADSAGLVLSERTGRPVETLIDEGGRDDVVALVIGARGRPLARRPLGTTAVAVATSVAKPVVVVPPDASHPARLRRVLVPLEGTVSTSLAPRRVVELAQGAAVDVVVLHVYEEESLPSFTDQPQHEQEAWAAEFLARYCPFGIGAVRLEVRVGRAEDLVPAVAEETGADLIALGWAQELAPGRARVVRAALERTCLPVMLLPVDVPASVLRRRPIGRLADDAPAGIRHADGVERKEAS